MSETETAPQTSSVDREFDSRPFYRKKRVWFGGIAAVMASLGSFVFWNSWVNTSLKDELRANGMPTNSKELDAWYQVSEDQTDVTDRWVPVIKQVEELKLEEHAEELPFLGTGERPPLPGEEWNELESAEEFLAEMQTPIVAAWKASEVGGVARYPVDLSKGINADLSICQDSRKITRLLRLDAWVAAHRGDHDRVARDIQAMLALAHTFSNEPILISSLIQFAHHSMACESLGSFLSKASWSDEQMASLQEELIRTDARRTLRMGFIGERAGCLDMLTLLMLGPTRATNEREMLRFFSAAVAASESSWLDLFEMADSFNARVMRMARSTWSRITHMGVMQLMPAIKQASVVAARTESERHCFIVVLAVKRHLLAGGEVPGSLDAIPDQYFPEGAREKLRDPFSGKALLLRRDGDRLIVYSIGEDFNDDGGAVDDAKNGGRSIDVGAAIEVP